MKSYYYKIFFIVAIAGVYLYLSHAYIYFSIKRAAMYASDKEYSYQLPDRSGGNCRTIYAALGDSLTAGVGVDDFRLSYPYLLADKMSQDCQIGLRIFAYPGARTKNLINDLLAPAILSQPDLVTLMIGVNDVHGNISLELFESNYRHILDRLTKETSAGIYLIGIPRIGSNTLLLPPYDYYFSQQTIRYNAVIKMLAAEYKLEYIGLEDFDGQFKHSGSHYCADNFHPSASGYKLWADAIYDDINQ